MIPTDDAWHEQLAAERAEIVTRLEQGREGCNEHGRID